MISVPCTESLPRLPMLKSFGLLKASESQIDCSSSPRQRKPLESSESFDRNGSRNTLGRKAVYSKYLDGALCLPSVCFGMKCGKNGAKLDKLFRSPLMFWTTARGRFDSHASVKSEIHIFSVMVMQNFLAAMRRQTAGTPIDQQLNR